MPETPAELLSRLIRARYGIIAVVSHEETRVLDAIHQIAATMQAAEKPAPRRVCEWSYTTGLLGMKEITSPDEYAEPSAALDYISKFDENGVEKPTLFVLKDIHKILELDLKAVRFLRDIAARFESRRHNVILLSPSFKVPADLEKQVALLDWPLPDASELAAILRQAENTLPKHIPVTLGENGKREAVVQALRGLTVVEAGNTLNAAIAATRELSDGVIPFLLKEKEQIIKKSGVLEYYGQTVSMSEVGGLEHLKRYAAIKRAAFSAKARAAGVDAPKGVLLVGVPGTGKSLAAKAIAGGQMPLLRMDVGALMGGLVGQSEGNMRAALNVAAAVSPAVLWLDEIEKALGGIGGGESDGGTTARVFGTLLTWMQEHSEPVYVVATANDVRSLRPELLRRFDDVMWVDLPNAESRREILDVHMSKRGLDSKFDTDEYEPVISATWGFSGAEIEKVVKSANETAFFDGQPVSANSLLAAARKIVPIGVTMKSQIDDLRAWATNRAVPAGEPLENQPKQAARNLGVEIE